MKKLLLATTAAAAIGASAAPALAADCDITIGLVMELTGPAGEYGQAGAKSVEMAFRDINDAGGVARLQARHRHARQPEPGQRRRRCRRRSWSRSRRCRSIIGGIISSVSIPILTSVTAPAGVVQVSPASSSPTLTALGREGKTNGVFFRTITSDALQGTAAAKYALDQGFKKLVDHPRQQRLRRQHGGASSRRPTRRSAAPSSPTRPTTRSSRAIRPKSTRGDGRRARRRSISSATPVDGATIARAWISQGGAGRSSCSMTA